MPSYLLSSIEIFFICWPSEKKKQEKIRGVFQKLPFPLPQRNNFSSNPRGCPQNSDFPPSKRVSSSYGHKAGEAVLAHLTPAEATLTGHRPGAGLPTAFLWATAPFCSWYGKHWYKPAAFLMLLSLSHLPDYQIFFMLFPMLVFCRYFLVLTWPYSEQQLTLPCVSFCIYTIF